MSQDRASRPAGLKARAPHPGRGAVGPALVAPGVGAQLRAARLRLGRELPDMAAGLRIKPAHLEALEEGRLADLPGRAYAAGFLRAYARALGLDADALAGRLRAEARGVERRAELSFPAPVPERGVPTGAAVLLGGLLAVGGYAGWYRASGDARAPAAPVPPVPERLAPLAQGAPVSAPSAHVASILPPPGPAPSPVRPAPAQSAPESAARIAAQVVPERAPERPSPDAPVAAAPPAHAPARTVGQAQAAPAEGHPDGRADTRPDVRPEGRPEGRIVLRAKSDTWVQVRERQGPSLLNRLLRAGETWPVPAGQALFLTTGNAAGTEVLVDGVVVAPLGGAGAVRRDVPLDPEALKLAEAAKPADAPKAGPPTGQTAGQDAGAQGAGGQGAGGRGPGAQGAGAQGAGAQGAGQPGARAAAPASTSRPPAQ